MWCCPFLLQRDAVPVQITETARFTWDPTDIFYQQLHCLGHADLTTDDQLGLSVFFDCRFALFSQLKITTSQHVS